MSINFDAVLANNPKTHSRDYPDSYYRATAHPAEERPLLNESVNVDVCVIGGGFSGINTALELAQAGLSVVLLEARRIGWGASGRNGGQLLRGVGQHNEKFRATIGQEGINTLEKMGDEAVDIAIERIQKHDIQCDLKMGSSSVALKPRHIRELEAELEHLQAQGYAHSLSLKHQKDIAEVIGSKCYIAALTLGGDGHLHPLNLCLGEAQAAEKAGARLYEYSPVTKIQEGKKIQIDTEKGRVAADFAVMCGNAYTNNMHKKITSKVLPAGSYIVATEPLSPELAKQLLPLDSAVCDLNYALDYFRLSADNRMLFGGLCNYSGADPQDIVATLRAKMLRVFPQLAATKIDYSWGGMIAVGFNRLPQIGRVSPNLYYAQGYAGHGVNATHIAARIIAESISQQSSRIDLFEKIKHHKFPGGKTLQSALFALGMTYFRMKDVLY